MGYLHPFNERLKGLRQARGLSIDALARCVSIAPDRIQAFESRRTSVRQMPSVQELVEISLALNVRVEEMLDLNATTDAHQMELPGLGVEENLDGPDVGELLDELQEMLEQKGLSDEERELVRRFRAMSGENRRLVLQLMEDTSERAGPS